MVRFDEIYPLPDQVPPDKVIVCPAISPDPVEDSPPETLIFDVDRTIAAVLDNIPFTLQVSESIMVPATLKFKLLKCLPPVANVTAAQPMFHVAVPLLKFMPDTNVTFPVVVRENVVIVNVPVQPVQFNTAQALLTSTITVPVMTDVRFAVSPATG